MPGTLVCDAPQGSANPVVCALSRRGADIAVRDPALRNWLSDTCCTSCVLCALVARFAPVELSNGACPVKLSVVPSRARLVTTSRQLSHADAIVGVSPPWRCHNRPVTDAVTAPRRPWILGIFLIIAGVAGWWAAFQLTIDKFAVLANPGTDLDRKSVV